MLIRPESPSDISAVYAVNTAAFETPAEADLVDRLRSEVKDVISLVAEDEGSIVGHILFSPMTHAGDSITKLIGLAPMAIHPDHQKKGVGKQLVEAGIRVCREAGYAGIVVLGHPEYYPRFGFQPASRFGLTSEYDVPDEVFMAMELVDGGLANVSGLVRYHALFASV